MAFVVRRKAGGFEIRESVHTERGPRARSLATFHTLDENALDRARAAATTPFDADAVRASARRVGAPLGSTSVDAAGRRLLLELRSGRELTPGLRALLAAELTKNAAPTLLTDGEIGMWFDATNEDRGRALYELMELSDALPLRERGALKFPPMKRARTVASR